MTVITRVFWTRWGLAAFQRELAAALSTPGAVLDHLDVVNGTSLLVSKGLLTAARRTAILAGTPPS